MLKMKKVLKIAAIYPIYKHEQSQILYVVCIVWDFGAVRFSPS